MTPPAPANSNERRLKAGVAYATPARQTWLDVYLTPGATVRDAIERSGILDLFPEIDLETQKVGIFGKVAKLDQEVQPGDRVEIYRPITADPKQVKRKRPPAPAKKPAKGKAPAGGDNDNDNDDGDDSGDDDS